MQGYLIENLKKLKKLAEKGMVITVAEKIKTMALYLDHWGYGKTIKEIKKNFRHQDETKN